MFSPLEQMRTIGPGATPNLKMINQDSGAISNQNASTNFTRRSKSVIRNQSLGYKTPMITPLGTIWKGPRELHYISKSPKYTSTGKSGNLK